MKLFLCLLFVPTLAWADQLQDIQDDLDEIKAALGIEEPVYQRLQRNGELWTIKAESSTLSKPLRKCFPLISLGNANEDWSQSWPASRAACKRAYAAFQARELEWILLPAIDDDHRRDVCQLAERLQGGQLKRA